jgi:hypothetical protein
MEWPAQLLMAVTYDHAGWIGLSALGGATVVLTWGLLAWCLGRYYWSAWLAMAVATLCIWFASIHFVMRPHLLAMPVLVVWAAEIARATLRMLSRTNSKQRRFNSSSVYPL